MQFFSKILTNTDTSVRLEVPISALERYQFPDGARVAALAVIDWTGRTWNFRFTQRAEVNHRRPAITGEWLEFVRSHHLKPGDEVIFEEFNGGRYRIQVQKAFKLFGKDIRISLDQQGAVV